MPAALANSATFDPTTVSDPLFFLDGERGYVPLDTALYDRIVSGEQRV